MSVNTAHAGKGVLIYAGECIILFCDHVTMEFGGSLPPEMRGSKTGRLYLTSHRFIFNNKDHKDRLQSFAAPFFSLEQVELEQPVFGANYIKGTVNAQPNGGWTGQAKFKLTFKHGGAIEFGQAMLKVASMASRNMQQSGFARNAPPPYTPPTGTWTQAPPPAYAPPAGGYYGWAPPVNTFPDRPPADGVYMYDAPPPYPGLGFQNGTPAATGFSAADAKAQEAAQSAYYDPSNPQYAYVPPPAYSESPPSYDAATKKSQ
ncbi:WW domain-binding protein 2-like isoform X2 [Portunus trituberculatus]|uniref:WW domain-binding protein 2-like isoform X2 n=1 Tax=Portunus trituberculatus TaxID=210409 RepID=UPI001E1CC60E|nr:WW domain-binding protein 2-like isoform X2 [Portunus trituberculatus]